MAVAVDFRTFQPTDSRQDLIRRVEQAPAEHAEAVLAAYELLEQLHDKDVLQLLTGMLSAKDTVIDHVVDLVSSPEAVSALRIVLMLGNTLKSVDPNKIHAALNKAGEAPPSLLGLAKIAASEDARRGMAVGLALVAALGEALAAKKAE
jgi:uncharacterized protein YjgD (DUF1641 family)